MNRRIGIVIAALALAGAGCGNREKIEQRLDAFPVRLAAAAPRDLQETLVLVGTIKAQDEATLFSRVPGKLLRNLVKEGDAVAKGQAVALVERDEVGVKFEPAPVPSTLDGIVARAYLDRGANVTLETPIALIADQRSVRVQAEVPERYAGKVALGQTVEARVEAYPERVFSGKITRLSPVVDITTRSTYMEAELLNPHRLLRSGMFAKLTAVVAQKAQALAVPVEALLDGHTVFVAQSDKVSKRDVTPGLATDNYVEIRQGLSAGERVVVFGLIGLKDGSRIEVLP